MTHNTALIITVPNDDINILKTCAPTEPNERSYPKIDLNTGVSATAAVQLSMKNLWSFFFIYFFSYFLNLFICDISGFWKEF